MRFDDERLEDIYDRTSGYCHLCHKKLSFHNYGVFGAKGSWEVEHSRARIHGGSHCLNNLYPACISCNRAKRAVSTRRVRARNGVRKAPLSRTQRQQAKTKSAFAAGAFGALIGGALAGPPGAWLGGALGARFGYRANPDK